VSVRASSETCGVKITWNEPDNGGSPILGYTIQVENLGGVFQQVKIITEGQEALISMSTLIDHPFYLDVGDRIIVKVIAKN
jgi:hypothetical protein